MGDSQNSDQPLRLRIFISSPGDVADERGLALNVLAGLNRERRYRNVQFEAVSWDAPEVSVPMLATETTQDSVNETVGRPSECDIVAVLLWSRLGTPLPPAITKDDGNSYGSGTEYEFHDALRAHERSPKGRKRPQILVYRRTEDVLLNRREPEFKARVAQGEAVDEFFAAFTDPVTGAIHRGINDYAKPEDFRRTFEGHVLELVERDLEEREREGASRQAAATGETIAAPSWSGSPYPGLRAFDEEQAAVFCGRGRDTDRLIDALRAPGRALLAVVGASGAGKSSLVRAGLLPRLKRGALPGSEGWLYLLPVTPASFAKDPILGLAARLEQHLPGREPDELAGALRTDSAELGRLTATLLAEREAGARLVLVVDHLEELFSEVSEQGRSEFLALLADAAGTEPLLMLLTVRADFLHRCLEDPRLGTLMEGNIVELVAPERSSLYEMIVNPAGVAGINVEKAVADAIVTELCGDAGRPEPGALPLMAYALEQLYEEAKGSQGSINEATYAALGGVTGAVGLRAEAVFAKLPGNVQGAFARVFRELVNVDAHGTPTRRRALRASFADDPDAEVLITTLTGRDARLLVSDQDTVEVAHEALCEHWPKLANWITDYGGDIRLLQQVEVAAEAWHTDPDSPLHQPWPKEALDRVYDALERLGRDREMQAEPLRSFIRPEAGRLLEEIDALKTGDDRRQEIGVRLARIGDPRSGIRVDEHGTPTIDWIAIPEGAVALEDDAGTFNVAPFRMACYPITGAQYRAFLEAQDGYDDRRWWHELEKPENPGRHLRRLNNHPADNVSWYEAMAFARWLDDRLQPLGGAQIRLPAEWEWQQAAAGGNWDNDFPWGDWQPGRANTSESGLGGTTAVGAYPRGASEQGVLDLAGNVWEWCLNKDEPASDVALGGEDSRELRGGSWGYSRDFARCAFRYYGRPDDRSGYIGFRLVLSTPID